MNENVKEVFEWIYCIIIALVLALLFVVNAGYGGGFSNVPTLLSDHYGMGSISAIHGITLSAWAFAGLTGNQLAAWIVIIIISREFIISGFRLIASDNGIVIAASYWGKFKTIVEIDVEGIEAKFAAASGLASSFILWSVVSVVLEEMKNNGKTPLLLKSANFPGGVDYNNTEVYPHYEKFGW